MQEGGDVPYRRRYKPPWSQRSSTARRAALKAVLCGQERGTDSQQPSPRSSTSRFEVTRPPVNPFPPELSVEL